MNSIITAISILLASIMLTQGVVLPIEATDINEKPAPKTEAEYYSKSIFLGDSLMLGYRNYIAWHKDAPVYSATFLSAASYSAAHALNETDDLHPLLRGKKQTVWENVKDLDADRVFILFGTNDLIVKDADLVVDDMFMLVDKIHENCPYTEVYVISMTPVYEGVSKGALNNQTVDIYNTMLQEQAEDHEAVYIDINTLLKNEAGSIQSQYCSDDYVHLTDKAYSEIWQPVFNDLATRAVEKAKENENK